MKYNCLLCLIIISCYSPNKRYEKSVWKFYSQKINTGFTVSFQHPNNTVFEYIENGLCVGSNTLPNDSLSQFIVDLDWCIWMENINQSTPIETIEFSIRQKPEQSRLIIDSIMVDNHTATRILTINKNTNTITNQIVTFNRQTTYFHISLHSNKLAEFEKFLTTIKIR